MLLALVLSGGAPATAATAETDFAILVTVYEIFNGAWTYFVFERLETVVGLLLDIELMVIGDVKLFLPADNGTLFTYYLGDFVLADF